MVGLAGSGGINAADFSASILYLDSQAVRGFFRRKAGKSPLKTVADLHTPPPCPFIFDEKTRGKCKKSHLVIWIYCWSLVTGHLHLARSQAKQMPRSPNDIDNVHSRYISASLSRGAGEGTSKSPSLRLA